MKSPIRPPRFPANVLWAITFFMGMPLFSVAQSFIGPRMGVTFTNAFVQDTIGQNGLYEWNTNVVTGLTADIGIGKSFDLTADLAYTIRSFTDSDDSTDAAAGLRLRYLDFGVFAKGKVGNKLKAYGMIGPLVSYGVGTRLVGTLPGLEDLELWFRRSFKEAGIKSLDVSAVAGIGIQYDMKNFLRLFIDARYIHGLLDVATQEGEFDIVSFRNRSIQVSGGFMFVMGKSKL